MDLLTFSRSLPKIELHAHLNGSLSRSTLLELKRYYVDAGFTDKSNAFFDEFEIGAGDSRNLTDCFQVFSIAHALTTTPKALEIATCLTLQEFQDDGCCYIELRSTPRDTPHMTKVQYVEAIINSMQKYSEKQSLISCLIVSINRNSMPSEAEEIATVAATLCLKYPKFLVGIELSGDPTVGTFKSFIPALNIARQAGLKVTLHCGEVCNPEEILDMINFKPHRLGHGTCIHPRLGGTEYTWSALCKSKIPVEICLTSNVNTKSISEYETHHIKDFYDSGIPVIICTDDKGVFATSLSQEYKICAEIFHFTPSQLAKLALDSCQYIFSEGIREELSRKLCNFIEENCL